MSLVPSQLQNVPAAWRNPDKQPSRTYRLDIDGGRLAGTIDGRTAVQQFVRKTLATARGRYPIYDDRYGSEIEALMGRSGDLAWLKSEIPRLLEEALLQDDRITAIEVTGLRLEDDGLWVDVHVTTTEGSVTEEVRVRDGV
ncbi:DUF2634 domain-containing protein [Xylanibacillus composti]|uniref:DUF2634 domain-containing protein n=1 Tax=Xylanibacillus composti TaxID=1572762 RepID=A0A8J4H702_9BACL|nr:DUF2634 domain-containing protein [Xylanibacillus composti]GIQ70902.1 hypothetical protein XYCOK13_37260 [Xylanibacillus composti]